MSTMAHDSFLVDRVVEREVVARPGAAALPRPVAALLDGPGWLALRLALDLLALGGASVAWVAGAGPQGWAERWPLLLFAPLGILFLALAGLHRRRLRVRILDGVVPLVRAVGSAGLAAGLVCVYLTSTVPAAALVGLIATGLLVDGGARIGLTGLQRMARVHAGLARPTLIVGSGIVANRIARRLMAEPAYGLRPVGFLDVEMPFDVTPLVLDLLGGPDAFEEVVERHGIRHVVLAYAAAGDRQSVALAHRAQRLGLELTVVPRLFDAMNDRGVYETIGGLPLVGLRLTRTEGLSFTVKHAIDRVGAAVALTLLSPLMLLLALLVRLSGPGPILFRQRRVGRDDEPFELLKFRTMSGAPDADWVPEDGKGAGGVEGVDRRTRIGRVLRRTSLDELPQFLNVLRGEMSLVGPRPERPELVERYVGDLDRYAERHRVRAGITGLAQANGLRGGTSLADRIELDNSYIEHWSLGLDLKIMLLTLVALVKPAE